MKEKKQKTVKKALLFRVGDIVEVRPEERYAFMPEFEKTLRGYKRLTRPEQKEALQYFTDSGYRFRIAEITDGRYWGALVPTKSPLWFTVELKEEQIRGIITPTPNIVSARTTITATADKATAEFSVLSDAILASGKNVYRKSVCLADGAAFEIDFDGKRLPSLRLFSVGGSGTFDVQWRGLTSKQLKELGEMLILAGKKVWVALPEQRE